MSVNSPILLALLLAFANLVVAVSPPPSEARLPNGLWMSVESDTPSMARGETVTFRAVVTNGGDGVIEYPGGCEWGSRLTSPRGGRLLLAEPDVACDGSSRASLAPGASLVYTRRWNGTFRQDGAWADAADGIYTFQAAFRYFPPNSQQYDDFGAGALVDLVSTTSHEDPASPPTELDRPTMDERTYPAWIQATPPCESGARPTRDPVQLERPGAEAVSPASRPSNASLRPESGGTSPNATAESPATSSGANASSPEGVSPEPAQPVPTPTANASATHDVRIVESLGGATQVLVAAREDPQRTVEADELAFRYDSFHGQVQLLVQPPGEATPRTMQVAFEGLVEFEDVDADGALGPADRILQSFPVENLVHFGRTAEDGCGVRLAWTYLLTLDAAQAQAALESGDPQSIDSAPRLSLRFTTLNAAGTVDGANVVPERVKIDINIEGFSYSSPGTRLAAPILVRSLEPLADAQAIQLNRLVTTGDSPMGVGWIPEAVTREGNVSVVTQVEATQPEDAMGLPVATRITFAYPQADSLLHDPELGVFSVQARDAVRVVQKTLGDPATYAVGALATLALLGVLALTRRG